MLFFAKASSSFFETCFFYKVSAELTNSSTMDGLTCLGEGLPFLPSIDWGCKWKLLDGVCICGIIERLENFFVLIARFS